MRDKKYATLLICIGLLGLVTGCSSVNEGIASPILSGVVSPTVNEIRKDHTNKITSKDSAGIEESQRAEEDVKEVELKEKFKPIDEIVREVLNGGWSSGERRNELLMEAGYDPKTIQSKVNEVVKVSNKVTTQNKSDSKADPSPDKSTEQITNGFNFNGYHFSIETFSGSGHVPQNTNNIYQWTSLKSHYLVERISPAGRVIRELGVGGTIVIEGATYKVQSMRSGIPNDDNAWDILTGVQSDISFQTCDTTKGPNGNSNLTVWWANKV